MEELKQPYSQQYDIRAYERDSGGGIPMYQICNYLQDIAGRHATELGWSIDALQEGGRSWVLSRLHVEMEQTINASVSELKVRTWPCGADRMYAYRSFNMYADGKHLAGRAITAWVLFDMEKRRPIPMPDEIVELGEVYPEPSLSMPRNRIQQPEETETPINYRVNPSDLDINGHVNHAIYVKWLEDTFLIQKPARKRISYLDILFKAEVHTGQQVSVVANPNVEENPMQMAVLQDDKVSACLAGVSHHLCLK